MPQRTKSPRNTRIIVPLTQQELEIIKEMALQRDQSMAALVRSSAFAFLRKQRSLPTDDLVSA
jgi:hypothetical protein